MFMYFFILDIKKHCKIERFFPQKCIFNKSTSFPKLFDVSVIIMAITKSTETGQRHMAPTISAIMDSVTMGA